MATLSDIRSKVSRRTGRGTGDDSLTNFNAIVDDAINEFLGQVCRSHPFKEMWEEDTLTISTGYSIAMPTESSSYFESELLHLYSVSVSSDSSDVIRDLDVKSYFWMSRHAPDRIRADANTAIPRICTRFQDTIQFQAPVDQTYTIYVTGTHLPKALSAETDPNPIPSLDNALVAYASYAVYEAIELYDSANRQFSLAQSLAGNAVKADWREPGTNFRFGERRNVVIQDDLLYNSDDLSDLYS